MSGASGRGESVLTQIFEALPFGILLVDRATNTVRFANARWTELFGVRPRPGQPTSELSVGLGFEYSDGTPYPEDELALPVALRTGQRTERTNVVTLRPDGTRIPVVVTALPVDFTGSDAHDAVLAVVQDRRELSRAFEEVEQWEERFENVVEANRQIVYDFDRVHQVVRWSRSVESVLGYPRDRMTSDPYLAQRLMHPDDRVAIESVFALARSGQRPEFDVEYRMRHADGRWLVVHDLGRVSYDDAGQAVRILGTLVDVTAQRELERQFEHAQRLETVGTLAGGIAHDFNNQLTTLMGHLDLLARALGTHSAAGEHVAPARLAARRCADLTRSLLTFSRKLDPQVSVVRPEDVVREALMFAERSLPASIRIETEIAADTGPIEADAGQVEQVLLNLFVNARDAMNGEGAMRVTLRNLEVDAARASRHPGARTGAFVEIAVGDSGSGIPEHVMPHIFEPFFTTKEVGRGTGLGLAMVHGIVHSHRGWIEVESVPFAGTWFRILLPRAARPLETAPAAARVPLAGTGNAVLVVDDEPLVRDMIANLLTAAGYTTVTAADGEIALGLFEHGADGFALAIVDMTMPGMNGVKLMEAMTARRPGFPVILSSGYSTELLPEAARRAAAFLSKPYGAAELLGTVRGLLDPERPGASPPPGR